MNIFQLRQCPSISKRVLFIVFLCAILVLVTNGCSPKKNDKKIVLNYSVWGTPEDMKVVSELVRKFEELHPDIKVKITHIAAKRYLDKIMTMMAAETPPDVIFVLSWWVEMFAKKRVILKLDDYVNKDPTFSLEDFFPTVLEQYKYEGSLYGIPVNFNTIVLFYNKTLFDKEDIEYPSNKWGWDTFLSAARRLTKDTNGDGRIDQFGYAEIEGNKFSWLWQNGGVLLNREKTESLLTSPEAIEAFRWITDLRNKYKVMPTQSQTQTQDIDSMFMTGRVAMIATGRWVVPLYKKIKKFEWDVSVLPHGKKRASILASAGLVIAKDTKYPKAAWQLVKYLTSREAQILLAKLEHDIPVRKSIAFSKYFLNPDTPPRNDYAFLESIDYGKFLPSHPQLRKIRNIINSELELVYLQRQSVEEACRNMKEKIDKILQE